MSAEVTYDYVVVRVVPRVERGERMNAGVILSCVDSEILQCRLELDDARLRALDPDVDLDAIRAGLALIARVCAGGADAGPIGELPARGRFRWLASPRSTMIQTSPVHTGRTCDPEAALTRLFDTMVRSTPAADSSL